jgi:cytochrome c-type biogenesis protein
MSLLFLGIAILAGVLTILAPCILPLLPIIIGSSNPGEKKNISKKSIVIIGSLAFSVILFTLMLKATTVFIDIPQLFWQWFSGIIIILVGISLLFPHIWGKISILQKINIQGNKIIGSGYQKHNHTGDAMIGFALGPVFTTCSPTYLFIIATILPASFAVGFIYLLGFTIGLILSLLVIAYFGQQITHAIGKNDGRVAERVKKVFAVLIIIVGIAIITGYDKKIETAILDSGYGATIEFEESLINRFSPTKDSIKNNY